VGAGPRIRIDGGAPAVENGALARTEGTTMTLLLLSAPLCLLLAAADPAAPAAPASPAAAPAGALVPTARLLDATAAWRTARWGMTVDEVLKALPGQAKKLEKEQRLADGKVIAVGIDTIPMGGLTYRAHFLFEGGKLALVSLRNLTSKAATGDDYEALRKQLAQETGTPGEDHPLDASVDYREIRFTAGGTAVDVKYMQGTLVLLYHPAGG
jgi:hypothetical protein